MTEAPLSPAKKYLRNCCAVFLVYGIFDLVMDFIYVKTGQNPTLIFKLGEHALSTLPVAIFVTAWVTFSGLATWKKILLSAASAFLFTVLGIIWLVVVGIYFHLAIGGTL